MPPMRTRFAPSPTGYLHLGHAASAIHAFGLAEKMGGTCLLRIEDIDTTRCKPAYETAIYEDLHWLGFDWPLPARRQSDHFADYQTTLETLIERDLVYRCFKTRKEIMDDIARAPHYLGEPYKGPKQALCSDEETELLSANKPYAWRLSLSACQEYLGRKYNRLSFVNNEQECVAKPDLLGDVILARKDVGTSYHLACCHDDALQNITHIVRGVDLLESTHIHRLLQEIMGWPKPKYFHHELVTDADGKKFSKRDKSLTIQALRKEGLAANDVLKSIPQNQL